MIVFFGSSTPAHFIILNTAFNMIFKIDKPDFSGEEFNFLLILLETDKIEKATDKNRFSGFDAPGVVLNGLGGDRSGCGGADRGDPAGLGQWANP